MENSEMAEVMSRSAAIISVNSTSIVTLLSSSALSRYEVLYCASLTSRTVTSTSNPFFDLNKIVVWPSG